MSGSPCSKQVNLLEAYLDVHECAYQNKCRLRSRSSLDLGQSVVHTHFSKIFFSETAWPIKVKFYVERPWIGGTKV